jgi:hypothetical protein
MEVLILDQPPSWLPLRYYGFANAREEFRFIRDKVERVEELVFPSSELVDSLVVQLV